ncbi:MAG: 30S ribosomal protein S8 [Humidesulfovibrio sp.]|nr:30S ribosomal protein S8 [Humidesulfovibrio sp.]
MSVVDPIADMLARIRNAHGAFHSTVEMPASKMKAAIAEILKTEGYISECASAEGKLKLTLKYAAGKPAIRGLKKVSTPGRRVYVGVDDIPKVQNGLGICILSTSRGLLAGTLATADKIGGELLCEIW